MRPLMSNSQRHSVFRISGITPVDNRAHSRVRVIKEGGSTFALSLPLLHEIDHWAVSQSPQFSRSEAINYLLRRGLSR